MKSNLVVMSALVCVSLSGCALFQKQQSTQPKIAFLADVEITLPPPNALNQNMQLSQIVSATYHINGEASNFTAQVEVVVNPQQIMMIAVSGWGGSLFKVDYNGTTIESSSLPMPNANMGVNQTLSEFIISYAPPSVLTSMFANTDIQVEIKPRQRCLYQHGDKIMCVDYSTDQPWLGQVVVHNYHYDYTVKVDTLSYQ